MQLSERIILVTGATGGLGRALCTALGQEGANVIALARGEQDLGLVQQDVEQAGGRCLCIPFDLTRFDQYESLFAGLKQHIPHLDGLVHLAGDLDRCAPMQYVPPAEFRRMLDIHLVAPSLLTQALLPLLERAPSASVIFTTCDMAREPEANWHGYGMGKAALVHAAALWQLEHPHKPMRFNALNPGRMRTRLFVRAYAGASPASVPEPKAAAQAYLYLLSDAAKDMRGQHLQASDLLTKA